MTKNLLHSYTIPQPYTTINRTHMLFHFVALSSLVYYRISRFLNNNQKEESEIPALAWGLVTIAEFALILSWIFVQAFRWRPVIRTLHPENMPHDIDLPAIDVFVCTADPKKEPTVDVMNTVLSAMALDYPANKLAVYLSDDGGAPLTLYSIKEACSFGRSWIPFCRKFGIKNRCPEAYFSSPESEGLSFRGELEEEEKNVKSLYEEFKKNVYKGRNSRRVDVVIHDRPPCVEVIHDGEMDGETDDLSRMPTLVYVSRERRPSFPHRYKAGALNTLLRVSGILSNGQYILVLDCDMYCNDPSSARQAMCFLLDSQISNSLAFVQYPQMFHNLSKNDIYDGQSRTAYKETDTFFLVVRILGLLF